MIRCIMKKIRNQTKYQLAKEIIAISLVLAAAFLPFSFRISSAFIFLCITIGVVLLLLQKFNRKTINVSVLLSVLFFVIPVLSISYSENFGGYLIEKRIAILFIPILLAIHPIKQKIVIRALAGFVISCVLAAVYSFCFTLYYSRPLDTEMSTDALGISHVYFGMYLSFSIVLLLIYFLINWDRWQVVIPIIFIITFLSYFLFIMGGKMSIISLVLVSIIISIWIIFQTKKIFLGLMLLSLPVIVFIGAILFYDNARGRFIELLDHKNYFIGDNAWNSIGVRLSILKCTYDVTKEHPFFGTGIGDVQVELNNSYKMYNFSTLIDMNTHNQYLQFIVGIGIVGLLIVMGVLSFQIYKSIQGGNLIHLSFVSIFMLCCLTESVLERQYGIMFFALFNSITLLSNYKIGNLVESK